MDRESLAAIRDITVAMHAHAQTSAEAQPSHASTHTAAPTTASPTATAGIASTTSTA